MSLNVASAATAVEVWPVGRGVCEDPDIPQFDKWHPTGLLKLTVGAWPTRKRNDTERSLIDARLRNIVATT